MILSEKAALGVIQGRMYDYNNARFLSVDPFIQAPTSTQSLNPYTYIFNNPLSGTDPTGYTATQTGWTVASSVCIDGKGCIGGGAHDEERRNGLVAFSIDSNLVSFSADVSDINNSIMLGFTGQLVDTLKEQENQRILDQGPLSSPVPMNFPDADGRLRTLILMHDGLWHNVGDDRLSNVNNQFTINSDGVAEAVRPEGLKTGEILPWMFGAGGTLNAIKVGVTKGLSSGANFAQKTFRNSFSDDGVAVLSEIAGARINTVDDLANAVSAGLVNQSSIPVNIIVRDGNTLILNTRTVQALEQAGVSRNSFNVIDQTGNKFFEGLLTGQLKRNKLTNEGISTVKRTGK